MTRFTPSGFARASFALDEAVEHLPGTVMAELVAPIKAALAKAASSERGVKVRPSDFAVRVVGRPSDARAAVRARGFGALKEFGSWHKPQGYPIEPRRRAVLAGPNGFFAAYVFHPPQKAHPSAVKAEPVIGRIAERITDTAVETAVRTTLH